jgi:hypothetical protein
MGKYATKGTSDEGEEVWLANDGKEYKTRAGAWKRSKTLEEKEAVETESNGFIVEEPKVEPTVEPEVVVDETATPDTSWVTYDDYDIEDTAEVIPSPLKKIRPASRSRGKMTKKEIEAARATNTAILKIFYRTGDYGLTKYRRMMLEDPDAAAVVHTETDYDWISNITEEALADNGISIGMAVGPTQVAVVANGYWFGAPIVRINAESDKSPFKGVTGGRIGRLVERLPIIGKWVKSRRQPEYTMDDFAGEQNE